MAKSFHSDIQTLSSFRNIVSQVKRAKRSEENGGRVWWARIWTFLRTFQNCFEIRIHFHVAVDRGSQAQLMFKQWAKQLFHLFNIHTGSSIPMVYTIWARVQYKCYYNTSSTIRICFAIVMFMLMVWYPQSYFLVCGYVLLYYLHCIWVGDFYGFYSHLRKYVVMEMFFSRFLVKELYQVSGLLRLLR